MIFGVVGKNQDGFLCLFYKDRRTGGIIDFNTVQNKPYGFFIRAIAFTELLTKLVIDRKLYHDKNQ